MSKVCLQSPFAAATCSRTQVLGQTDDKQTFVNLFTCEFIHKSLLFTEAFFLAFRLILGIKIDIEMEVPEDTTLEELTSSLSEDNLNKEMIKQVLSDPTMSCCAHLNLIWCRFRHLHKFEV